MAANFISDFFITFLYIQSIFVFNFSSVLKFLLLDDLAHTFFITHSAFTLIVSIVSMPLSMTVHIKLSKV